MLHLLGGHTWQIEKLVWNSIISTSQRLCNSVTFLIQLLVKGALWRWLQKMGFFFLNRNINVTPEMNLSVIVLKHQHSNGYPFFLLTLFPCWEWDPALRVLQSLNLCRTVPCICFHSRWVCHIWIIGAGQMPLTNFVLQTCFSLLNLLNHSSSCLHPRFLLCYCVELKMKLFCLQELSQKGFGDLLSTRGSLFYSYSEEIY